MATVPTAKTAAPVTVDWRMWVPCFGMALCSWLSFVDRQVLGALAPTILKETGLNAQEFAGVNGYFFVAYTLANPFWGSVLDFVGLRVGMLMGVALWTAASVSHAWMGGFMGFALARAALGFGEGVTFPGGLRTAVESLPADRRARAIALSFSGGTLGGVAAPLIAVPIGIQYGWRAAFMFTGLLGVMWMAIWIAIARPPFLPKVEHKARRMSWPNPLERRLWALVFSYALPAISPGPILTLLSLYLNSGLGVSQRELGGLLWMPPFAWGIGYFFWGWAADRFAPDSRPIGMFLVLTAGALVLGATTWTSSVGVTMAIMSWSTFIGGGFQMLALKVASLSFPREQAAMMTGIASGSWALVNYVLLQFLGPLFNQHRYGEAFWLIAILPAVGVAMWWMLGSNDRARASVTA